MVLNNWVGMVAKPGRAEMNQTDCGLNTSRMFRKAEIRAERLVALLRMAIAVGLGFSFFLAVRTQDAEQIPELIWQWIYASAIMVAYFILGLVSWVINQRGYYQPWMAWPSASADCLFVLGGVWLSLSNVSLPGNFAFVFPSIWLAPLVLTFGALRFNPWLQAYLTVILVLGLFGVMQFAPPGVPGPRAQSISLFFASPPNYMRLAMLALAGLVLVVASVRARAVLLQSITETQHSLNLRRYLPSQLASRLAEGGLQELRRGKHQPMGVLFIDIRGFTGWSQHRQPHEISEFMTQYRRRISKVANATGGIIDKFIGDGAMIVFEGEPDAQAAANACVSCAERLDMEMSDWSQLRAAAGEDPVRVGIGLHWGQVFSGVVGDPDRLEYSVFGDTVNTAARLEEMTKECNTSIVASLDILRQAGLGTTPDGWKSLGKTSVRGRSGTVELWGRKAC